MDDVFEPNTAPAVSVVVVTWNSVDVISDCLESVLHGGCDHVDDACSLEVIVVDNGSTDGTLDVLDGHCDDLRVRAVRMGANVGFAPSTNVGIAMATAPLVLLLNPDARLEADSLSELVAQFDDPKVGICGPRIIRDDRRVEPYGARRPPSAGSTFLRLTGVSRLPGLRDLEAIGLSLGESTVDVPMLTGAAIMIRSDVLARIGRLDTTMPMYLEDLELFQACRDLGLEVRYVGTATAKHLGGHSAARSARRQLLMAMEDGQAPWLFLLRHSGRAAAARFRCAVLVGSSFRLAVTAPAAWILSDRRPSLSGHRFRSAALVRWAVLKQDAFEQEMRDAFATIADPASRTLKMSVLIHNSNRAQLLDQCLSSVAKQDYRPLEVIVHDAESTDGSGAVIDHWMGALRAAGIEAVEERRPLTGVAASRNALSAQATGDLLFFVDNDATLVSCACLGLMVDRFADDFVAAASARVILRDGSFGDPKAWVFRRDPATWWDRSFDTFTFAGTAVCVRATAYRSAGAFWDVLPYAREEEDLAFALLDRGWRLRYEPGAAVRHFPAEQGRMPPAERRQVELRNGAMVLWRRLPMVAALPAICARTATMTVRAHREGDSIRVLYAALPAAVRMWRGKRCKRAPVGWRSVARYLRLQRPAKGE